MSKRIYFPALETYVEKVVNYYATYGFKLPTDLKAAIDTAMLGLDTVLLAIQLWDFGHAGGRPSS